jgi:hypothetical protein
MKNNIQKYSHYKNIQLGVFDIDKIDGLILNILDDYTGEKQIVGQKRTRNSSSYGGYRKTQRKHKKSTQRKHKKSTQRKHKKSTQRKHKKSTQRKHKKSTQRKHKKSTQRKHKKSTQRKHKKSTQRKHK